MTNGIEIAKIVFLSALVITCGWLLVRAYHQRWTSTPARDSALSAGIDGKIDLLQRLIGEADQRIARLEVLNDRAARPPAEADLNAPRWSGTKTSLRVDAPVERAASPAARCHEEIYALADTGLTSAAIAGHIGSPVGEVELILGLRQTRG